jgi:two-component SAPR family response regulator
MTNQYIVCIIDDDSINQFIINRVIDQHNFTKKTLSFLNGQEAIDYLFQNINFTENLPDFIFVDINMPLMNGWDFLEQYQKLNLPKKTLIYLLSASIDNSDFEKSKTIPEVTGYLVKPIQNDQIEDIIAELNKVNKF